MPALTGAVEALRRAEAVRLLRRNAELLRDFGERGYCQGLADSFEALERPAPSADYVDRLRGRVDALEAEQPALDALIARRELLRQVTAARRAVTVALGLNVGPAADDLALAHEHLAAAERTLERHRIGVRPPVEAA